MIGEDDNHEVAKDSNFESEKLSAQVLARDIGFVDHYPYNTVALRINKVKT